MSDDAKVDSMEEPEEVTELNEEELEGVAGGMFPASTHEGGAALAFPDVCKTPSPESPVPIPYPIAGTSSDVIASTNTVKLSTSTTSTTTTTKSG